MRDAGRAQDPGRPDVTVVTVTFNSGRDVAHALASAKHSAALAGLSLEFIVVDNGSWDGSVATVRAQIPTATIIANTANLGFGAANNQAFELARGESLLLLNPDARLDADAIGELIGFLRDHPLAAAAAPAIPSAGGAEHAGMMPGLRAAISHFLLLSRLLARPEAGPWQGLWVQRRAGRAPRVVDWASAAVLVLRAAAVREVGGFDDRIFMYAEDIDLCTRLRDAGWEIWLVPRATAQHAIAGSQSSKSVLWIDGVHAHYARLSTRPQLALFDVVMALGLGTRGLAMLIVRGEERRRRRTLASARRSAVLAFRTLVHGR